MRTQASHFEWAEELRNPIGESYRLWKVDFEKTVQADEAEASWQLADSKLGETHRYS